jgi:hypothetical protein
MTLFLHLQEPGFMYCHLLWMTYWKKWSRYSNSMEIVSSIFFCVSGIQVLFYWHCVALNKISWSELPSAFLQLTFSIRAFKSDFVLKVRIHRPFKFYNGLWSDLRSGHFTELCTHALYEWPLIFETSYVLFCHAQNSFISF